MTLIPDTNDVTVAKIAVALWLTKEYRPSGSDTEDKAAKRFAKAYEGISEVVREESKKDSGYR